MKKYNQQFDKFYSRDAFAQFVFSEWNDEIDR